MSAIVRVFHAELRRVIASTFLVVLALLVAPALVSEAASIVVTADGDRVYISGSFDKGYREGCEDLESGSWTYEFDADDTSEACSTYASLSNPEGDAGDFLHFRVRVGNCYYLDARFGGLSIGLQGTYSVELALPIETEITESSFDFASGSDYHLVDLDSYWSWPISNGRFVFERGNSYNIQLFRVPTQCGSMTAHPEELAASGSIHISCCDYHVGDANCSGDDEPTIGDIEYLIDELFISGTKDFCCLPEADVNQSGGSAPTVDDISLGDVAILIDLVLNNDTTITLNDCIY